MTILMSTLTRGRSSEATPSFALMDVQGPVIVTYVYQLVDGEVRLLLTMLSTTLAYVLSQVKVDKVEYRRPDQPREGADAGGTRTEIAAGW